MAKRGRPKKEDQVKLVEKLIDQQKDMNALTVDKINDMVPVSEPESKLEITKKMAEAEGVIFIEPKKKLMPFGKLPEKLKKEHAHDWEYVKGILENMEVAGEPIEFWYCKYPGDPDCLWNVPCNRPVYVPRMIAKHLESTMKYHDFQYVERPINGWEKDRFKEDFTPVGIKWRAKFRPVEAFA